MKVKGVNLGNWLVLEKWMNPALFEGTTAEDEYWLPRQLSKEVYEARIKIHRSEYITERDFVTIKSWGLDAVRIPVPYFIFGFTYWLEVNLDNIIDTLLSVLSIFTALIFGVLFTVPDKLPHRIEKLNQKKKIMLLKIT